MSLKVNQTDTAARFCGSRSRRSRRRLVSSRQGHAGERDGDHRADGRRSGFDLLRERVCALVAIGGRHDWTELLMGDVFKARQMDAGFCGIVRTLQRARQAEYCRRVHWIEANRLTIFVSGLGKLLALEVTRAKKIMRIRRRGIDLHYLFKGVDAGFAIALRALQ